MKKILLSIVVILITSLKITAQTTDVVTGLVNPSDLLINGNDMYIGEGDKISLVDLSAANPSAQEVVSGVLGAFGIAINGTDLYISEFSANKISKIDLTASTPTIEDVVTGLNGPADIIFNGNDLYVAERNGNKITKIDITLATPVAVDFVTGLTNPFGLLLNGNDLYFTEITANKVSKVDISDVTPSATDVVTGLSGPNRLTLDGNQLYISEYSADKISKIDISTPTPIASDVVTGLNGPVGIGIKENSLYIVEYGSDKVSKFNLAVLVSSIDVQGQDGANTIIIDDGTLQMEADVLPANADDASYTWSVVNGTGTASIDVNGLLTALTNGTVDVVATANDGSGTTGMVTITISNQTVGINENNLIQFNIYPNPVQNELFIDGLSGQINQLEIIDHSGRIIFSILDKNVKNINVSNLNQGMYILKISTEEGISTKQFIKK